MADRDDFLVTFDFGSVQRSAERVRDLLFRLRAEFDLAPFEYCRKVRIAPLEIPYSHPEITLGTWANDELSLLASYLHEQMHWYVTWYWQVRTEQWYDIFADLRRRYARVPTSGPEGAPDEHSTYLHLVVNWLEIDVTSRFFDREQVVAHAATLPYYRWIYRTVIEDWRRPATGMSAEDLRLAGVGEEAPP